MRSLRRFMLLLATAGVAVPFTLPTSRAFAQTVNTGNSDFPDLVPVAIWTGVAAVIGLTVVSIGYLYRREQGMDRPLRMPPVEEFDVMERRDKSRDAEGQPLPDHVIDEHSEAHHDDATERAQLLHERRH